MDPDDLIFIAALEKDMSEENTNTTPPGDASYTYTHGGASPGGEPYTMTDSNINALRSYPGNQSTDNGRHDKDDANDNNIDPALGSGAGQDGDNSPHLGTYTHLGQFSHPHPDPNMAALQNFSSGVDTTAAAIQAQGMMAMPQETVAGAEGSSRKRSKVSRACDECRRKKVRLILGLCGSFVR
jgi:hypothetical protein